MTENSDCMDKSDVSTLSTCDPQPPDSNIETVNMVCESKNDEEVQPVNEMNRRRPSKLFQKFRRFSLNSLLTSRRERISSCHTILTPPIDITPIPNGELKPKGILKNSTESRSQQESVNKPSNSQHKLRRVQSLFQSRNSTNDKENSNGLCSLDNSNDTSCPTPTTSPTDKRVRFNDEIIEREYKPLESVPDLTVLSLRQQKKIKKFQRQFSLSVYSIETKQADEDRRRSADSLQFQHHPLQLFVM